MGCSKGSPNNRQQQTWAAFAVLLDMTAWQAAHAAKPRRSPGEAYGVSRSKLKIDRVIRVGTDVAAFYLFHLEDLAHRRNAHPKWLADCAEEMASGSLVAFETGGGGGFSFRITSGKLTRLEQAHRCCGWTFRAAVRHGQLFLDGGEYIPFKQNKYDPRDTSDRWYETIMDRWVDVPNGNYRVSVHAIQNSTNDGEPIDGLTSYVIQFERVTDLTEIKPVTGPVSLLRERDWKPGVRSSRNGRRKGRTEPGAADETSKAEG
jgi:hypothetical protein